MTIDDEFQDFIELGPTDTFGQLTPSEITTIVPSFGKDEIAADEVGFALEHEHLRRWGAVVFASYRDWLNSPTPFLSKLTLHQSEAVILTSNYGTFFRMKFPYPSGPFNLAAEETIELHIGSLDLIQLLSTGGSLKSFRYSRTRKTLRAYAELFERPILLHNPNRQLYLTLPKTLDVHALNLITLNSLVFHRMVSLCAPYISERADDDAVNYIQVSGGTLVMLAATAIIFFRSKSIDQRLDFKLPEQSLPVFLAASKLMETGRFAIIEGFNTISSGNSMFGWEIVRRDRPTEFPRNDKLGVLLLPKAKILSTLQRINGLLPDCAAVFSIKEADKESKSNGTHILEVTAHTPEGKRFRQVIDSIAFHQSSSFSETDATFSLLPREALPALRYSASTNAEFHIHKKLICIALDQEADELGSEALLRNLSS